jgi:hypothetical protein
MSFAEKIAEKLAQMRAEAARREDPELESKLDQFIQENPKLHERLTGMSKDQLVRQLISEKIGRAETVARRNRELEQWFSENPGIVSKVEERLKILADDNRQRVAANISHTEVVRQEMRGPRIQP